MAAWPDVQQRSIRRAPLTAPCRHSDRTLRFGRFGLLSGAGHCRFPACPVESGPHCLLVVMLFGASSCWSPTRLPPDVGCARATPWRTTVGSAEAGPFPDRHGNAERAGGPAPWPARTVRGACGQASRPTDRALRRRHTEIYDGRSRHSVVGACSLLGVARETTSSRRGR